MPDPAPSLHLHDTLTRQTLPVQAADGKTLRFYCCGPTVYGPAHIGNFRTFISQDIFRRVVELSGTPTLHVRNITDVDDKTIRDSQKAGQTLTEFTQFWTKKFHADCAALNLLVPEKEPKATDHIREQIDMIKELIARNHAYYVTHAHHEHALGTSVYFSVGSFQQYGKLSHLENRELKVGAAAGGGLATSADEYSEKDSLVDFVLWKAQKPEDGDNGWDSPWGKGRPGWHIECSAMSLKYLGVEFDLHGGGIDLIFPHHENEIAQSCCATDGHFARHWMHSAHLMVDGGKMSKSLGNLYTLEDLGKLGHSPMEVRYTLLSGHYRQPLNFTLHSLEASRHALVKLAKFEKALREKAGLSSTPEHEELTKLRDAGALQSAWDALLHDLNVPEALGHVFSLLNKTKPADLSPEEAKAIWQNLHFILDAIGIVLPEIKEETFDIPDDIKALAEERWQARKAKDWAKSDELRKQLEAAGWMVKDGKDGYQLLPRT